MGQVVQASDREAKLLAVRKFATAYTSTEQLFPGSVPCVLQDAFAHVENALPMQTKEMQVIRPIHEMAQDSGQCTSSACQKQHGSLHR